MVLCVKGQGRGTHHTHTQVPRKAARGEAEELEGALVLHFSVGMLVFSLEVF